MKKILIMLFGLILCSNAYAKTKFSAVKNGASCRNLGYPKNQRPF